MKQKWEDDFIAGLVFEEGSALRSRTERRSVNKSSIVFFRKTIPGGRLTLVAGSEEVTSFAYVIEGKYGGKDGEKI
jgi:hypothetical protein